MEYNDDIASNMLEFVNESAPQTQHFSDIATSLVGTATELDQVGSSLAGDVDRILADIVQVVGG